MSRDLESRTFLERARYYVSGTIKALIYTTLTFAAVIVMPLFLFVALDRAQSHREHDFFSDKLEVVEVLASKRLHTWFGHSFQCQYEIVRYSEAGAALLAEKGPEALFDKPGKVFDFQRTPMPPRQEMTYRTKDDFDCMAHAPGMRPLIPEASREPGNWYSSDGQFLILPEERIAAWGWFRN